MRRNKLLIILIFLGCFIGLLGLNIPLSSASSTETTGLSLNSNDTNINTFVSVGSYDCVATDKTILIYNQNDGSLSRTYNLIYSAGSPVATSINGIYTNIMSINSTVLLISYTYCITAGSVIESGLLNVVTGVYTSIGYENYAASDTNFDTLLVKVNNIYYALFDDNVTTKIWVKQIYPTFGSKTLLTSSYSLYGSTIYVQSNTDLNTIYIITKNSASGSRANIFKINVVTPTFSYIGQTGIDNTYGNYVYMFGSNYDSDGTNYWYDIGIIYNNPSINKDIYPQIIRFNDTYVGYIRNTLSASSSVNLLRCLSVSYDGIWDRVTLLNGGYEYYYVGSSYGIMLCPFTISNLLTINPSITIVNTPSSFGDNGVQFIHYYTSSNNVGGYLFPSGNFIDLDYQNGKVICDKWISLNPTYGYVFSLTPQPLQIISSGTVLRAVCKQLTTYTYTGELFLNGVRDVNGTFTVSTTGLSTNYNIDLTGSYSGVASGSIVNGLLTFSFSGRYSNYVTIYEGIKVSVTINGNTQDMIHLFVWTTDNDETGLPPSTPSPTNGGAPTVPPYGGSGGTGAIIPILMSIFGNVSTDIIFIIYGIICGLLIWKFALTGLIAGIGISTFLCTMAGLLSIWAIGLCIVLDITLIVLGSGLLNKTENNKGN